MTAKKHNLARLLYPIIGGQATWQYPPDQHTHLLHFMLQLQLHILKIWFFGEAPVMGRSP